jgi:hypothetical protein
MRKPKQLVAQAEPDDERPQRRAALPTLQVGHARASYERRNNIDKEVVNEKAIQRPLTAKAEKFLDTAERMGLPLDTVMRTLPRDGITIGATYSENYCSVRVDVHLSQTISDFDKKTRLAELSDMQKQADHLVTEILEDLKKTAFR